MNQKLIAFRVQFDIKQRDMAKVIHTSVHTYGRKERMGYFTQKEINQILKYARNYDNSITVNDLFFY